MMVNRDIIIQFIKDHFQQTDYRIHQNEIQMNTPFEKDHKKHLGISLGSEKMGVFNDFKTGTSGDFITFVSRFLGKSREDAKSYLISKYPNLIIMGQMDEGWSETSAGNYDIKKFARIPLPNDIEPIIQSDGSHSYMAKRFITFLKTKWMTELQIKECRFHYGYAGEFNNYLIMPFFDDKMNIIYYVARTLQEKRYKNPLNAIVQGKEGGIGYNIFTDSPVVVICEGIFDALRVPNYSGIAILGNKITDAQIEVLLRKKREKIIFAGDNFHVDDAGKEGMLKGMAKINEFIKDKSPDTKIYTFLWKDKFRPYKDFSRCPFDIRIEDILSNSEEYNPSSGFVINAINKLFNMSDSFGQ